MKRGRKAMKEEGREGEREREGRGGIEEEEGEGKNGGERLKTRENKF